MNTDPVPLADVLADLFDADQIAFSVRFREVSNAYPLKVSEAFDGDHAAALSATDAQVADRVAAWEARHGMTPRDWRQIGIDEGRDDPRACPDVRQSE